ncbi:MAG: hypothetical protein KJ077_26110 [Anaerolineae bacterium]|nr:hypothetical protein [Anaerolineae bacterium]
MASDREIRQQELARLLLQKAYQDLALVANVSDSEAVADRLLAFTSSKLLRRQLRRP